PRPGFANVVVSIALFVALGGGAYAAATEPPMDGIASELKQSVTRAKRNTAGMSQSQRERSPKTDMGNNGPSAEQPGSETGTPNAESGAPRGQEGDVTAVTAVTVANVARGEIGNAAPLAQATTAVLSRKAVNEELTRAEGDVRAERRNSALARIRHAKEMVWK